MTLPNWLLLITLPLGVARAMMFVMNDVILDRPRDWVKARHVKIEELLECPWCTGLWLSLGACALLAWDYSRPLTKWLLVAFTISLLIVAIERIYDRVPLLEDRPTHGTLPDHRAEAVPPDAVAAALHDGR